MRVRLRTVPLENQSNRLTQHHILLPRVLVRIHIIMSFAIAPLRLIQRC
mgnify:CR=1 FL=1